MRIRRVMERNEKGEIGKFSHLVVERVGPTPRQNFADDFVARHMAEGLITIQDDMLTLRAKPEDLKYKILRHPGRYTHRDRPDEVIHCFECELDEKQFLAIKTKK